MKTTTIKGVIEEFLKRASIEVSNPNSSVIYRNGILYSYGQHFPLALWINNVDDTILVNGDKYSITTNKHQATLLRVIEEFSVSHVVVSREALMGALNQVTKYPVSFTAFAKPETMINIIDIAEGYADYKMTRSKLAAKNIAKEFRKKFTAIDMYKRGDGRWVVYGHIAPMSLISYTQEGRVYYVLSGFDDNKIFFSSVLCRPCKDVQDALDSLKPPEVLQAIEEGTEVVRQGEWFFVKVAEPGQAYKMLGIADRQFKVRPLPSTTDHSNQHVCRIFVEPTTHTTYCTGTVFHRTPDGIRTGEHKRLKLDGYYIPYHNTALVSSTSTSKMD
jgi:hypothetical protein